MSVFLNLIRYGVELKWLALVLACPDFTSPSCFCSRCINYIDNIEFFLTC